MKTIKDVFTEYRAGLAKLYDAGEIDSITSLVIGELCGLSKAQIKAFPEHELSEEEARRAGEILSQLQTGKPVQYILGKTEFYGLPFKVNSSVLIPRPETEELVEWTISSVGNLQLAAGHILDIGTGSGCIAISLKKALPGFAVSAIDISDEALRTAKENAKLNQVDIGFIQADILSLTSTAQSQISNLKSQIWLIVSNPPYVTLHEKTQMHINVTGFEPHTALFVPQEDPLVFYKGIAGFAVTNLSPGGLLFFEINESYGNEVVSVLKNKGFTNIELKKDMAGRDRMVRGLLK